MIRTIRKGEGWRLGWNPSAETYCGLVGSDRWSIELTTDEFEDFCRCARQLADTMQAMSAELMDEERITCEQETPHIWMEAEGLPSAYTIRFMLRAGRRGEGEWLPAQTRSLIQTLHQQPFCDIA